MTICLIDDVAIVDEVVTAVVGYDLTVESDPLARPELVNYNAFLLSRLLLASRVVATGVTMLMEPLSPALWLTALPL